MSVELEIYINNVIKFFNKNPNDLSNLIPLEKKEEFFSKVREIAKTNVEKGDDPTLTRNQLIEVCLELNEKVPVVHITKNAIVSTKWGEYSLN